MFPFFFCAALGQSAQTLVGKAIGAGDVKEAKILHQVVNKGSAVVVSLMTLLMLVFQDQMIGFFLNKNVKNIDKTIELTHFIFTVFSPLRTFFNWYFIQCGVMRALGLQGVMAKHTLICYWGISPLLVYLFGWPLKLGFSGLWLGMICGEAYLCIVLIYIIQTDDWDERARLAKERMEKEKEDVTDDHKKVEDVDDLKKDEKTPE